MEYLFVYGTLLRYFKNEVMQSLKDSMEFINHGELQGTLIDLGDYPGLTEDVSAHNVKGEIYRITDAGKVFALLDEYEGEEYTRKQKWIRLNKKETIGCWVYVYQLKSNPEHKIIMNGDYLAFIRNKG
jgi:gamma-glutamylcyclotransferase (GGCT)/AIG2-like uncharacterized protein YtfP